MQRQKRFKIYTSKWHLLATFLLIVVPFLFLYFFLHFSHIPTAGLFIGLSLSLYRIVIAYFIAVIIGWICAVLLYKGRGANVGLPIFDVLQSFPTFAALPLATLAWGSSNFTVIFFLVAAIIWPIFFSIVSSLKLMRHDWHEVADLFGLSGFAYLRYFLIPASLPGVITGSIVGLGDGWEALIATEIIVSIPNGLGSFFSTYAQNPKIIAFGICGFLLLIFSINKLIWLALLEWSHRKMEE